MLSISSSGFYFSVFIFFFFFFFFNDTATTEIYTLSLHDALPIFAESRYLRPVRSLRCTSGPGPHLRRAEPGEDGDRKSTRLNSSHMSISYAVFCLKKKKKKKKIGTCKYMSTRPLSKQVTL